MAPRLGPAPLDLPTPAWSSGRGAEGPRSGGAVARENPSWGTAASTVRCAGSGTRLGPAPSGPSCNALVSIRSAVSWRQFLRAQAKMGVRYSTWIESRVSQCSVMIVLIGDAWASAKDQAGRRRLELPRDWVRQEIEAALARDIPIIPVRVQGARMPSEEELPPSIVDLTSFQSAEITDSRWTFDVGRLMQAIDDLVASSGNQ